MDEEDAELAPHPVTEKVKYMHGITDVLINQHGYTGIPENIVTVTVLSEEKPAETYDALLISGKTLYDFLSNKKAVLEATHLTKCRFALLNSTQEDRIHCHIVSNAMHLALIENETMTRKITREIESEEAKKKRIAFARKGGEKIKIKIRNHYEQIRPSLEDILSKNPDLSNHKIAKKLNEMGLTSVNNKQWRYSNVENMKEYFENNPAYHKKGKKKLYPDLAP